MRFSVFLCLVGFCSDALAQAPEIPTSAELKKVIHYYYKGKDLGPLLADFKACLRMDLDKESPTRNECLEEVSGPVARGTHVHAWTLWMVPDEGQYDDVAIQFVHEGNVRSTIDLNLTPALRSRAFRASVLSKPGTWQLRVVRQGKTLSSIDVRVP